ASTMGGQQAFKDGGIFDGIGNALSGAWDKVKSGADWLSDTFGAAIRAGVNRVVNPLIDAIPGGSIGLVGLLKDLSKGAVARLLGAGEEGDKKSTPHVDYRPTAGVEQWRGVVLKALTEVGQPHAYANITLRRMNQESGGNPTIVNTWDSNWKAGHPSVGLMQVIGPTFRSYAGKYRGTGPFSYGVSTNPLANVYSSMRYALSAYGSLPRAYNRAGGYDSGGFLQPGFTLAYNGTGKPEPVLTGAQWNSMTRAAGEGAGDMYVSVYVGDREITDIARAEVRRSNGELIQVLNAGGGRP
ncbi:transglycosylase SLT domain-containing protein, partial [Streptomyces roseolus]|uniref:transglycosylase SLT domain-containing protein n=1 Tax=Streptomyces roseolus TaxID=67358 RepID=UPI0036646CAB